MAKTRPKQEPNPAIKRAIDRYHEQFLKRHGIKPRIDGAKHGVLFRTMIQTWGEDAVVGVIDAFVWGNEPWAVRRGWTVEALYNVAQRILTKPQQQDQRTSDNLDAAHRATQKRGA